MNKMVKRFGLFFAIALVVIFVGIFINRNKSSEPQIVEKEVIREVKIPGEVKKRVITQQEVDSKLVEMEEFSSFSGEYDVTYVTEETRDIKNFTIPGTKNKIEIKCKGIVKVGYDMKDVKAVIDEDKIYISLPKAKVNDNYVIWDTVECNEKNNVLNPIHFSRYQEMMNEIEAMGLQQVEEKNIYDMAEENMKTLMSGFLSEFVDYEIVYM